MPVKKEEEESSASHSEPLPVTSGDNIHQWGEFQIAETNQNAQPKYDQTKRLTFTPGQPHSLSVISTKMS